MFSSLPVPVRYCVGCSWKSLERNRLQNVSSVAGKQGLPCAHMAPMDPWSNWWRLWETEPVCEQKRNKQKNEKQ